MAVPWRSNLPPSMVNIGATSGSVVLGWVVSQSCDDDLLPSRIAGGAGRDRKVTLRISIVGNGPGTEVSSLTINRRCLGTSGRKKLIGNLRLYPERPLRPLPLKPIFSFNSL